MITITAGGPPAASTREDPDMTHPTAVASACTSCAGEIGSPPAYAPGRHMTIIHDHHMPSLVALGWTVTDYPDEPPDCVCPHYPALCQDDEP